MKKYLNDKIKLLNDVRDGIVNQYNTFISRLSENIEKFLEAHPNLKPIAKGIEWIGEQVGKILNFIVKQIFACGKIVADVAKNQVSYICDKFGWKFNFTKNNNGEVEASVTAAA